MRILIIWTPMALKVRQTIKDHVFSFQKYDTENEYFYLDSGIHMPNENDYNWIKPGMFDAIIFHYTVISLRSNTEYWNCFTGILSNILKDMTCVKVLLPQDDYTCTKEIWNFANAISADIIYTVLRKCDYPIVYPENEVPNILVDTVLTGYVEKEDFSCKVLPHSKRKLDCVYRARKLPYVFGKHGQLKYEIATIFNEKLEGSGLVIDIQNTKGTNGKKKDTAILGKKWFDFLASSRCTIGCLGGAGFADFTGEISKRVNEFMEREPNATYEDCKKACFPEQEENLTGAISPRIFEAALTKTTQVLVGNDYQGVLIPDVDYIMIKEDFSNINDVIEKMKNVEYCERIAENCYKNVVESEKYSYMVFVKYVLTGIIQISKQENEKNKEVSQYVKKKCREKERKTMLKYMAIDSIWNKILNIIMNIIHTMSFSLIKKL